MWAVAQPPNHAEMAMLAADHRSILRQDEPGIRPSVFATACVDPGCREPGVGELHCVAERVGPLKAGQVLFHAGAPLRALFVVHLGALKTSRVDFEGREQILEFHLPGDTVGLDAIYPQRYLCDAVALEPTECCGFPIPEIEALAEAHSGICHQLVGMLSKELGSAGLLAGNFTADERVAAFLLDLSARFTARGLSGTRFRLSMSRCDVANYLRLAAETVSRVLARFRRRGLIMIDGRDVELLNLPRLRTLARCALGV